MSVCAAVTAGNVTTALADHGTPRPPPQAGHLAPPAVGDDPPVTVFTVGPVSFSRCLPNHDDWLACLHTYVCLATFYSAVIRFRFSY